MQHIHYSYLFENGIIKNQLQLQLTSYMQPFTVKIAISNASMLFFRILNVLIRFKGFASSCMHLIIIIINQNWQYSQQLQLQLLYIFQLMGCYIIQTEVIQSQPKDRQNPYNEPPVNDNGLVTHSTAYSLAVYGYVVGQLCSQLAACTNNVSTNYNHL